MKLEFKNPRVLSSLNTDVSTGSFAIDIQPLQFDHCRERFAATFNENTTGFYFKHSPGRSKDIASFIIKTESVLGNLFFSEFAETNRDSIIWVCPNMFWKQCPMRRSLFTALLRAGDLYRSDIDNYESALFGYNYLQVTKKAVIRFMFGFTDYVGPDIKGNGTVWFKGWKSTFEEKNEIEIKKMLISHKYKINDVNSFKNCLWI